MPGSVFILSPARLDGERARVLLREEARFPLAMRLRREGAPIGEVFAFLSGLYFRGKLAYALAFRTAARGGVLVIVPGWGLVAPSRQVTLDDLRAIGAVGVSPADDRFREPLERDARRLAARLRKTDMAILLGSIASDKYVGILEQYLGGRLHFPAEFVGRGDMSRGGLMLRCVLEGSELRYVPIAGAVRHGSRPPRLRPLR